MRTVRGLFALAVVVAVLAVPGTGPIGSVASAEEYALPVPDGIISPEIPEDNPVTAAKIELGQKLYFDPRLSQDDTISCATCHDPRKGFADARKVSLGVGGSAGVRNSPTVLNAAYFDEQFWDGRVATLEDQAVGPPLNPVEMAMPNPEEIEKKLRGIAEYGPLFEKAFESPGITYKRMGQAIASFERTLLSFSAPIDRFLAGDATAISPVALKGWVLFNSKARCNLCHGHVSEMPTFSDNLYHNLGVGAEAPAFAELAQRAAAAEGDLPALTDDLRAHLLGRFLVTQQKADIGAFKTPGLRNVELTAPYMHDGSEATLEAVVEFYNKGGAANPFLDELMQPLNLTDEEQAQLVEFLKALTSDDLDRFKHLEALMPGP